MNIFKLILSVFILNFSNYISQELIIGEERIEPGIVLIFEGAIKDMIMPSSTNLNEKLTFTFVRGLTKR